MFNVSIFFCLIAGSLAVKTESGPCPNVTAVDINLTNMAGRWFKYASTQNEYDSRQKCMTIYWSYPLNGVTSAVAYSISTKTEILSEIEAEVTFNKENYVLTIVSDVPLIGATSHLFWEIEVINDSHAISYACKEVGSSHIKSVAVYTRERNPRVDVLERARIISAKNGISVGDLKKFNDEGCHY